MIDPLTHVTHAELDALTRLWEASVRATHHFLQPADIDLFRELVRNEALSAVELYVVRNSVSRDAQDPSGCPYPILHLEL